MTTTCDAVVGSPSTAVTVVLDVVRNEAGDTKSDLVV
jgi:hypothetical protein